MFRVQSNGNVLFNQYLAEKVFDEFQQKSVEKATVSHFYEARTSAGVRETFIGDTERTPNCEMLSADSGSSLEAVSPLANSLQIDKEHTTVSSSTERSPPLRMPFINKDIWRHTRPTKRFTTSHKWSKYIDSHLEQLNSNIHINKSRCYVFFLYSQKITELKEL